MRSFGDGCAGIQRKLRGIHCEWWALPRKQKANVGERRTGTGGKCTSCDSRWTLDYRVSSAVSGILPAVSRHVSHRRASPAARRRGDYLAGAAHISPLPPLLVSRRRRQTLYGLRRPSPLRRHRQSLERHIPLLRRSQSPKQYPTKPIHWLIANSRAWNLFRSLF